jgi:hypothetical protein
VQAAVAPGTLTDRAFDNGCLTNFPGNPEKITQSPSFRPIPVSNDRLNFNLPFETAIREVCHVRNSNFDARGWRKRCTSTGLSQLRQVNAHDAPHARHGGPSRSADLSLRGVRRLADRGCRRPIRPVSLIEKAFESAFGDKAASQSNRVAAVNDPKRKSCRLTSRRARPSGRRHPFLATLRTQLLASCRACSPYGCHRY